MSDQTRINGNAPSWASVSAKLGGQPYVGFKDITYGDSRTRTKVRGMKRSQAPMGQTSGLYETENVVATILKATANAMRKQLAALSGSASFGNVEFQVVVQYIDTDGTGITDVIERCTWAKANSKNEEGPDPLYETVEWQCLSISWDGVYLYDDSQGPA